MKGRNWDLLSTKKIKSTEELIEVLLLNRGIKKDPAIKEFFEPKNPYTLSAEDVGINSKNFARSIYRAEKAIKAKEKIIIYGDYDADGICATAIMWESLNDLGADVLPFIPDRFSDGYGLSAASVKRLKEKHPNLKLLITVDNGIVAYEGISEANKLGIDVVVTDHHTLGKSKNNAYSLVHTTSLSGSGISWFFASKVNEKYKKGLELAAIGTISDQLPLLGVNRSIVKHGLEELNKTSRVGLKKLFLTAGLLDKKISTYEVNFVIAPRINASGRIAEGMDALRLLCTTNSGRAQNLAIQLNELNARRQSMVDEALNLSTNMDLNNLAVISSASESYHEGVIGLVASKLVEKYYKPSIVLSIKQDIAKASARSVEGFNIIDAIRKHEELIIEGGGHSMAAGFSIKVENITIFMEKINQYAKPLLSEEILKKRLKIDSELNFGLIDTKLYNIISEFEPHGVGNPAPTFMASGVDVKKVIPLGNSGKHLKLTLEKDGVTVEGLVFNYEKEVTKDKIDLVFKLSLNEWNGRKKVELILKDYKNYE